jgi:hypothetical protein
MIPTQINPNGPGMQYSQPLDTGVEIVIGLANRAAAVMARGAASLGQYPFQLEL